MGLFGRGKSKASDENEFVEPSDKKVKKGKRGKKQKGLIESMGLNEAVASMGLSVLEDIVESNEPSAVRSLDDGYTVLVVTEKMLEEQDIDPKSADFGSFANAIKSEHIQSFLLKNDLDSGTLVIIPDRDTLEVLDEFSILQGMVYHWGIIPHDVEDESTVIHLNNGATLGDLNVIASEAFDLVLKNGEIYTPEQLSDTDDGYQDDTDEEDVEDEEPFDDNEADDVDPFEDPIEDDPFDDEDIDLDDDSFDDLDDDLGLDDDLDIPDEDESFDDFDDETSLDMGDDLDSSNDLDDLDDLDDLEEDLDDLDDLEDLALQSEDEGRAMITSVLSREFQNDELGVVIQGDAFNQQFGDVKPILFEEKPLDDSELGHVIAQMRHDANIEIMNFHNTQMQALRSHYQNGLADVHDRLVENLDYTNNKTGFGKKYSDIGHAKAEKEDMADELIARNKEALNQEYSKRRKQFGERAKQEALAKFDDQNKSQHDKEKYALQDEVYNGIQLTYDEEVSDLYDERRQVAKRLFDKMTTKLLLELQKMFTEKMKHENEMYDTFRASIDTYSRENYADEILRAQALATQQRQHHEADEVRAEYEQMLTTKQRELEEAESKANVRINELEKNHSTAIKETIANYKRQIKRQESDVTELRKDARDLQDKLMRMDKEKDEEYSHQMNTLKDTIAGQREQLAHEQDRSGRQGKQTLIMGTGMVVVGVALGLILGFLIGTTNSVDNMAPASAYESGLSMDRQEGNELDDVLIYTFNTLFSDDVTLVG